MPKVRLYFNRWTCTHGGRLYWSVPSRRRGSVCGTPRDSPTQDQVRKLRASLHRQDQREAM